MKSIVYASFAFDKWQTTTCIHRLCESIPRKKYPRGWNNSNTIESADQMTKAVEEWTHKKSCPSIEVMNFVAEFCFTVFRLPFEYSNFADWMCNGRNFSDNEPRLLIVRFSFQPFNFHFREPVISLIVIPLTLHHPHYSRSNETCHSFFSSFIPPEFECSSDWLVEFYCRTLL